jgi:hypothetical protein
MRTGVLTLGSVALALTLSLAAPFASADEWRGDRDDHRDGWHERWHEGGRERWEGRDEYRNADRDRYDTIRREECAIERDRARLDHELREGDWREVQQLRWRLWQEQRELNRYR